jgi:hypothetical protein
MGMKKEKLDDFLTVSGGRRPNSGSGFPVSCETPFVLIKEKAAAVFCFLFDFMEFYYCFRILIN